MTDLGGHILARAAHLPNIICVLLLCYFLNILQEDQLGLSLLTLEQVQSEDFQKKIQQAAMEVS